MSEPAESVEAFLERMAARTTDAADAVTLTVDEALRLLEICNHRTSPEARAATGERTFPVAHARGLVDQAKRVHTRTTTQEKLRQVQSAAVDASSKARSLIRNKLENRLPEPEVKHLMLFVDEYGAAEFERGQLE